METLILKINEFSFKCSFPTPLSTQYSRFTWGHILQSLWIKHGCFMSRCYPYSAFPVIGYRWACDLILTNLKQNVFKIPVPSKTETYRKRKSFTWLYLIFWKEFSICNSWWLCISLSLQCDIRESNMVRVTY